MTDFSKPVKTRDDTDMMVQLPSGRLAIVIKVHDNGDCDYREGNGTVTTLGNYEMMEQVEDRHETI